MYQTLCLVVDRDSREAKKRAKKGLTNKKFGRREGLGEEVMADE